MKLVVKRNEAILAYFLLFQTTVIAEIALKIAELPKEDNKPRTVVITQGSNPTVVAKG